jgi:4-hydroxy-3-methylbut-2-enyl diphosphate reductase
MKIELAKKYGFCFGVKRAIKIAEETQNASTYGPLIHNRLEIDRLKNDFNVNLKNNISDFQQGDKAIIRTHGIEKKDIKLLQQKKVELIDATCPFVKKPQEIVKKMSDLGYDIVIFGDKEHPEIKGVKSYSNHNAYVVLSINDLKKIKLKEKIVLVSQTTRKISNFLEISNFLITHYKEVRVFNTICNATFENQLEAKQLSEKADIMIVIGGKNSSNTKQLVKICLENCIDSYHIESTKEIQKGWFYNKKLCGITAGASTPDWIIKNISEIIEKI